MRRETVEIEVGERLAKGKKRMLHTPIFQRRPAGRQPHSSHVAPSVRDAPVVLQEPLNAS